MINLADKLTAKTVEGILADSNEIKYTKEMGNTAKAETVAKELSNITDSMSGLSNSVTALSQEFETTQSDIEQLLNKAEQYTDRFVDNPIANSENAGLMPAADKTKLDSYPAQFVLDLGLVESQTVGEQTAARSEVAGNRNISFIRFQVQGVSTLKTTLIMQWPNGINQTAQIMCVDKAQWRRNVTGATGVKGNPTNAFQWERIAPQRIVYNASNRKIRLEDYECVLVSDVELPLATSSQPGLLSADDKAKIDTATGQLETVRKLLHSGASWTTVKAAFDVLGGNYSSLWALANTVKTFLEASDTSDATINRWQELESFLQGITDTDSLTGLLETMKQEIGTAYLNDLRKTADELSGIPATYAELVERRARGGMLPGTLYRITDYETMVANDTEARSAGHPFDVVVMALDEHTLSERAWAMHSARDAAGYFGKSKLEAWQGWDCLDNDDTHFQWADTTRGKGVIYRLIDEWGNDCPYDFKNVQFKRCLTSGDFVDNVVDNADWPNTHYILSPSMNGQADMTADETDYKWLYTFTYLEQMQDVRDASLINEVNAGFESAYYNKACNCNEMQAYYISEFIDDTAFATQALNNIVLSSHDEENGAAVKMYANKWGAGCFNMTFHEHCYGNSFGVNCYCLIGFKLYYSTFGNNCNNNTFGNDCNNNTFGNDCYNNTFGNNCYANTFGNYCTHNTFGNNCTYNTFGNYLQYITAGEGVKYLNVTGGRDVKHFVKNAHILNGTSGKDSKNMLTVGLPEMSTVCRYVGKNTVGVLKIWVPADLV